MKYHASKSLSVRRSVPPAAVWVPAVLFLIPTVTVLYFLSPILAAAVYVSIFLVVGLAYPQVTLVLVFATTPFQNDISAGGPVRFSLAEINLILTLPICALQLLANNRPLRLGPVLLASVPYLVVCLVASLPTLTDGTTLTAFIQTFIFLVIAVGVFASLPEREEDLIRPLKALACLTVLLGTAALFSDKGYVLGLHKNALGASLASAAIVCAELWCAARTRGQRRTWGAILVVLVAGLVHTLSRGGWMAAFTGVLTIALLRRQYRLILRLAPLLVVVVAACWVFLPDEARDYATSVQRGAHNVESRYKNIELASRLFGQNRVLGNGVGVRKLMDATNLVWVTLAETGIIGLAAFAFIFAVLIWMVLRAQSLVDKADPLFSLLAVGAALSFGRIAHGMVDHYWVRGSTMMCWAAVGMATRTYHIARARASKAARRSVRTAAGDSPGLPCTPWTEVGLEDRQASEQTCGSSSSIPQPSSQAPNGTCSTWPPP